MHSLDDVPAVIEHPPDVLCVHGASEVGVAVVSAVAARSADPLREKRRDKHQRGENHNLTRGEESEVPSVVFASPLLTFGHIRKDFNVPNVPLAVSVCYIHMDV